MSCSVATVSARHALSIIEAAYSLEGTDADWLQRILDVASPDIDRGCGVYGFTCTIRPTTLEVGPAYVERGLDPKVSGLVRELNRAVPRPFFEMLTRRAVLCGGFVELARKAPALGEPLRASGPPLGMVDAFSLFAQDGEGYAVDLTGPADQSVGAHPRVRGVWARIGVHLASAMRLRRHFSTAHAVRDAVLTPEGTIAHAEGRLRADTSARAALARAVRSVERARTDRERRDPERAIELWRGLAAGEWSLVDHWEGGGRRYVAAYRNRPHVRDPRGLTQQEAIVLRYAALAASNKDIAFTLGLSVGAVASTVSQILRKLRCHRRSDLLAFGDPARGSHLRLPVGDDTVDVLSLPHDARAPILDRLSVTEREIASQIVAGRTNAAIAASRATSVHTVANQIRGIFEKLGVGSRAELVMVATGAGEARE